MKVKTFISNFLIIFVIAFIISVIVTYIYNYLVHGEGIIDWATAFRLAITLGVLFPTISLVEEKRKK